MSKENVVLFTRAVNRKFELRDRLGQSTAVGEWVTVARDAGFEFTAEEFRTVVEKLTGRSLSNARAVYEYRLARRNEGASALDRRALALFIGGVARTCDFRVAGIRPGRDE